MFVFTLCLRVFGLCLCSRVCGVQTPLRIAAQSGHSETAALLIKRGADMNKTTDHYGQELGMSFAKNVLGSA